MQAMWVAKTGLEARQIEIQAIGNNLANINTIGFKKDRAQFSSLVYQNLRKPGADNEIDTVLPTGLQLGAGVKVVGLEKVYSDGAPQITDQVTDLMIGNDSRAFFKLEKPDGGFVYSRNGQFKVNAAGNLVHAATGYKLDGADALPENYVDLQIGRNGLIQVKAQGEDAFTELGQIEFHRFANPAGLEALGSNVFQISNASGEPFTYLPAEASGAGAVISGSIETSNVNMVEEMVKMIEAQRSYEVGTKVLSTSSDMMRQAITQT